jgi:hypothetical protein
MGSHMDEVLKRGTRNLEHYIQVRVHDHIESTECSLTFRLLDHLAVIHLLQRLSGLLEVIYPRILPSTWRQTAQTSRARSFGNRRLPGHRQRFDMHLPMHANRCGVHDRAPQDCQMCQYHGFLLDECGLDNSDGSSDLYPAFPLGSQAANPSKTEVRSGYHAWTRFIVSYSHRNQHCRKILTVLAPACRPSSESRTSLVCSSQKTRPGPSQNRCTGV